MHLFVVDGVRFIVRINPDGYELVGRPATEYQPNVVSALNAINDNSTSPFQIPTDDGSVTEEDAANYGNAINERMKKYEVVSLLENDTLNGSTNINLFSRS